MRIYVILSALYEHISADDEKPHAKVNARRESTHGGLRVTFHGRCGGGGKGGEGAVARGLKFSPQNRVHLVLPRDAVVWLTSEFVK